MKIEGHLETGRQLENSGKELSHDPDKHVKAIMELIFGAAHHYVASGLERKHGEHSDKHGGTPGLLRKHGEQRIAEVFESIDRLRTGRFYGRKGNGEIVARAFELLEEIKKWLA